MWLWEGLQLAFLKGPVKIQTIVLPCQNCNLKHVYCTRWTTIYAYSVIQVQRRSPNA